MKTVQKTGLALFVIALMTFIGLMSVGHFRLTEKVIKEQVKEAHQETLLQVWEPMLGQDYGSPFSFVHNLQHYLSEYNEELQRNQNWEEVIWDDYSFGITKSASTGILVEQKWLFFLLTIGMGVIGALMYILPKHRGESKGIKNNGIFHDPMKSRGWLGIITGIFLISFYVLLYWFPAYIANWTLLLDPLSRMISGQPASQWFLYGFLYTLAILVMGVRMYRKYRGNAYQMVRTTSVMFFQLSFAFLIPEILVALNKPWHDFKNIWPLDYSFFFSYRIDGMISGGTIGFFMLFWGIILIVLGVPLLTYFFGKRWYCSWVCGCGGLAETMGDPYRHLSDKSLKAWKVERWMVHAVLLIAVVMTGMTLANLFTDNQIFGDFTSNLHQWYGFLIGAAFAGVVGTGFYPLMGNRVWCRFGCPLAAYLGIVQRFKSRFRITTNGGNVFPVETAPPIAKWALMCAGMPREDRMW